MKAYQLYSWTLVLSSLPHTQLTVEFNSVRKELLKSGHKGRTESHFHLTTTSKRWQRQRPLAQTKPLHFASNAKAQQKGPAGAPLNIPAPVLSLGTHTEELFADNLQIYGP